jgi:P-type Mg2+ transporter
MTASLAALSGIRFLWRGFRGLPPSHRQRDAHVAQRLLDAAATEPKELLKQLDTTNEGLTSEAATTRLSALGPNLVAHERQQTVLEELIGRAKNPLNFLLLTLAAVSYFLGDTEGRKIFGNIVKYIKMGASSNFGNMLSVLGASIFLPFLPMAPIQVLTNNLLYDFSQTTIPTDNVDDEYIAAPRHWDIGNITKFMLCLGPVSSIFDYVTYATLLFAFGAWSSPALFQTGWFVESLRTQTLIIHIIRTAKIPFLQSRASTALIATTVLVAGAGALLPYSQLGPTLGFVPLPGAYWPAVFAIILGYCVLAHLVKSSFVRRWGM